MDSAASLDESLLLRIRSERSGDFLVRLIDLFLREAPRRLEEAWLGGRSGDVRRTALAAHTLACLAGNVGAVAVRRLACESEAAAEGGKDGAARLPGLLFDLEVAFAEARACLLDARSRAS